MMASHQEADDTPGAQPPLVAVLAEATLTVREVLALKRNGILSFEKAHDEALDLVIGDRRIGSGRAITTRGGKRFAVRLESVQSPPETPGEC